MLRRNFLKLLGLLPLGFIPKKSDVVPTLISNESILPKNLQCSQSIYSLYAKVKLVGPYFAYDFIEVELDSVCRPEIGDFVYLSKDGAVSNRPVHGIEPIGMFVTKAYRIFDRVLI